MFFIFFLDVVSKFKVGVVLEFRRIHHSTTIGTTVIIQYTYTSMPSYAIYMCTNVHTCVRIYACGNFYETNDNFCSGKWP